MLGLTAGWLPPLASAAPLPGQIIVDPANPRWFSYSGGGSHFLAGAGDPEDFLYRGSRQSDGTRSGDQSALINKMIGTGANGIYFQAVRSHGGDGDATHNPFVGNDPDNGLNEAVLDQWETWITALNDAGIVTYFFFYDDSTIVWHTDDNVGTDERDFFEALVNRFESYEHLVWVVAEEYNESYSAARMAGLAEIIRDADDHDHPIGVHKLSGLSFSEFANNPDIDQFTMQYNEDLADDLHEGMVDAWDLSSGRYNLNMSEAAGHGTGATARRKNWAIAMGGAYVMVLEMDIASTSLSDLRDLGRLASFMESTDFNVMSPHDELAHAGTEYVLALPGTSYIAYSADHSGSIGIQNMTSGSYRLRWFDPIDGDEVTETRDVGSGDQSWTVPSSIGSEVALYITPTSSSGNSPPTAIAQQLETDASTPIEVHLTYTDPDGPGPYQFSIIQMPSNGSLTGADGDWTYTPNPGFLGNDSLRYTVFDGADVSTAATVQISVVDPAANTAPVAFDQSVEAFPDTPIDLQLSFDDSDGPGPYTITIVSGPDNGLLSGTGNDRTYTPDSGFTGSDSISWRVSDSLDDSNTAVVNIDVLENADTDGPVIEATSVVTQTTVHVTFNEALNETSAETVSNYAIDQGVTIGAAELIGNGRTVRLTVSTLADGRSYELSVTGVLDSATPPNPGTSTAFFTYLAGVAPTDTEPLNYAWGRLATGQPVYVDRGFTFSSIPVGLDDKEYLQTANDDKFGNDDSFIAFTLPIPATVFVAYDSRLTRPAWLASWTETGTTLITDDTSLALYEREFQAGRVVLGGNVNGGSMYSVVVVPLQASSPDNPAPPPNTNDDDPADPPDSDDGGSGAFSPLLLIWMLLGHFIRQARSRHARSSFRVID